MTAPWYNAYAYGQADLIDETQTLIDEGGQILEDTSVTARQTVPLRGRPQLTMILVGAGAGLIGALSERPLLGLGVGAALGWFAHRTWGASRQPRAMGYAPHRRGR